MMRPLVIHGALLLGLVNIVHATDCSTLARGACRRDESCTWLNRAKTCVPTDTTPCPSIAHGKDCTRIRRCDWFDSTKCIESSEMTCSLLNRSRTCNAYRRKGCLWLDRGINSECVDEKDINCNVDLSSEEECRQMSKCLWKDGTCVTDNPEKRCQDCEKVTCPPILCQKGYDIVTQEGSCCPSCVKKQDCSTVRCAQGTCFEGEKLVTNPGECCPSCQKVCPCPTPNCAGVSCPATDCRDYEEPVTLQGDCCPTCMKRMTKCRGKKCPQMLPCNIGEVVASVPGQCCPVCKEEKPCPKKEGKCSVPEKCALVRCAQPACDLKTHVLMTREGECCPECVRKNACNPPPACAPPLCQEGERTVMEPDQCCPSCKKACECQKPDCSLVKCARQKCGPDEDPLFSAGGCCNTCVRKPQCFAPCGDPPICSPGQVLFREPGACCPECKDMDCIVKAPEQSTTSCTKDVVCPLIKCASTHESVVLPGECCPTCVPKVDCSLVRCAAVACTKDEVSVVEPGTCCPVCKKEPPGST